MTLWHFLQIQSYLVLFYLVYIGLSYRNSNFRFNRIYLLVAPVLAISIPFLSIQALGEQLPVIYLDTIHYMSSTPLVHPTFAEINWQNTCTLLYIIGAMIVLIRIVREFVHIRRLIGGELITTVDQIRVYRSTHPDSFSFFHSIVLSDHQLDHADVIVRHELAHCRQLHTVDLLLMSIYKVLFWFNPFIYLLEKRVRENHEFLADRAVMLEDTSFDTYTNAILSVHFNSSFPHFGSGFNAPSLVRKRIQNMKHQNNSIMKHLVILPALGCLLVATTSMSQGTPDSSTPMAPPPPEAPMTPPPPPISEKMADGPEFPGGMEGLIAYFNENLVYPESLKKSDAKGKVFVEFVVKANGSVDKVTVKKSSSYEEFDKEAVRLIKEMPKWKPGTKNGKAVDVEMVLPVAFTM